MADALAGKSAGFCDAYEDFPDRMVSENTRRDGLRNRFDQMEGACQNLLDRLDHRRVADGLREVVAAARGTSVEDHLDVKDQVLGLINHTDSAVNPCALWAENHWARSSSVTPMWAGNRAALMRIRSAVLLKLRSSR